MPISFNSGATTTFCSRLRGSKAQQRQAARTEVAFNRYANALIVERRCQPQSDLLSALLQAEVEGKRPLGDVEVNALLQQLLFAGHETTTNFRVEPQSRTAPPQTRTSAINTSGSSASRFRCIDGVHNPGRGERMPL